MFHRYLSLAVPFVVMSTSQPLRTLLLAAHAIGTALGIRSTSAQLRSQRIYAEYHPNSPISSWPMDFIHSKCRSSNDPFIGDGQLTLDTQMTIAIIEKFAESDPSSDHFHVDLLERLGRFNDIRHPSRLSAIKQLNEVIVDLDLQLVEPREWTGPTDEMWPFANQIRDFHEARIAEVWGKPKSKVASASVPTVESPLPTSNTALVRNVGVIAATLQCDATEAIAMSVGHTLITHHLPVVVLCSIIHTLIVRRLLQPLMASQRFHHPYEPTKLQSPFPQLDSLFPPLVSIASSAAAVIVEPETVAPVSDQSAALSAASSAAASAAPPAPAAVPGTFTFGADFAAFIDGEAHEALTKWLDAAIGSSTASITATSAVAADTATASTATGPLPAGINMSAAWIGIVGRNVILAEWATLVAKLKVSHELNVFANLDCDCILSLQIAMWAVHVSGLSVQSSPVTVLPDWAVPANQWILDSRGFDTIRLVATIGVEADKYGAIAGPMLAAMFPRGMATSNLIGQLRVEGRRDIIAAVARCAHACTARGGGSDIIERSGSIKRQRIK